MVGIKLASLRQPEILAVPFFQQIAVSTPLPTDYPVLAHFRARSAVDTALEI